MRKNEKMQLTLTQRKGVKLAYQEVTTWNIQCKS